VFGGRIVLLQIVKLNQNMKKLFLVLFAHLFCITLLAQSQTGSATFNKSPQPAVVYELPYSGDAVSNAIENKLSSYGKPKKVKGFMMYKNILVTEISKDPITLYFSAEKKSSKDNNNSVLTMIMSNDFDRFYTIEENTELFNRAKTYLNSFEPSVAAASLELQIKSQDETVNKLDKKLKNLRDDGIGYEKQKKKLDEKMSQNSQDIANQEQELGKQKEQLDLLIKQRKN
jgi:hypothetical protein